MPWEEERKVSLIHLSTIPYTLPPALERERRRTSPPPPLSPAPAPPFLSRPISKNQNGHRKLTSLNA